MPVCRMFKHGMTINPLGKVRPCCMYKDQEAYEFNEISHWRKQFARLYEESKNPEWLPGCIECKKEEEMDGSSLRTEMNRRYRDVTDNKLMYWDLKIHNTCNLTCRLCTPHDSSSWRQLLLKNPEVEFHNKLMNSKDVGWHKKHLDAVKKEILHTDILKFTGGEPMMIPHVRKVIEHVIDHGRSVDIRLLLTTNATHRWEGFWEDIIPLFKSIHISNSIDAIGSRFEYVRSGGNWLEVVDNMKHLVSLERQHDNLRTTIAYTPQAINLGYAEKTKAWADSIGLEFHHGVEVEDPLYLSYAPIPPKLREKYNLKTRHPYDPQQWEMLKKQMAIMDNIYNTDFRSECVELFEENV